MLHVQMPENKKGRDPSKKPAVLGVLEAGGATWREMVLERPLGTLHDHTGWFGGDGGGRGAPGGV